MRTTSQEVILTLHIYSEIALLRITNSYHISQGLMNSLLKAARTHYSAVILGTMVFQITSLTIVYSTVYSGAVQRQHQSSASLAFVQGIHRWPVNSPHKWPVTRKMLPFDGVIIYKVTTGIPHQSYVRHCSDVTWAPWRLKCSTDCSTSLG